MEPIDYYQSYSETENENNKEEIGEVLEKSNSVDGLAITSMVLGIVSIFLLGIITGTIGLVFAILSRKKGKNGINLTGMICSIVGISLYVAGILFYVTVLADLFKRFM